MKKIGMAILGTVALLAVAGGVYYYQQQQIDDLQTKNDQLADQIAEAKKADNTTEDTANQPNMASYTSKKGVSMTVTAPASDSKVASPLEVKGSVPGTWSNESQFTVRLLDSAGAVLDEQPAKLTGDWMTERMVPFSVTLVFSSPEGSTGSLVLEKADPSDLPANDDSLTILVKF